MRTINAAADIMPTVYSRVQLDWILHIDAYSTSRIPSSYLFGMEDSVCRVCVLPTDSEVPSDVPNSLSVEKKLVVSPSATHLASRKMHTADVLSTHHFSIRGFLSRPSLARLLNDILYPGNTQGQDGPHAGQTAVLETPHRREVSRVYRVKGVVYVHLDPYLNIVQGVYDTFDIQPSSFLAHGPDDNFGGISRFVFIGLQVDADYIWCELQKCVVVENSKF